MGVWNLYRFIQADWPEPDDGRQNMENTGRDEGEVGDETACGLDRPLSLSVRTI